jgi:predicted kinase
MELIIFVGLQGAGKSTFYQQRFAASHVLVSKDRLRNNPHKQRRQMQLIEESLAAGHSVVVDNTNPTAADRAPLIAAGRAHGATITGYYFAAMPGAARERNRQREGRARVPDVAIYATHKRMQPPAYAEGFDHLYTVAASVDGGFVVTPLEGAGG